MSKGMRFLVGVLSITLLLGVVFVGTIAAQGPTNPATGTVRERVWTQMHRNMSMRLGEKSASLLAVAVEQLDVSVDVLLAELGEGATLREVIVARGGSAEGVVAAFVAGKAEVLNDLVADGRLTREQADAHLARVEEMANTRLDTAGTGCVQPGGMQRIQRGRMGRGRSA